MKLTTALSIEAEVEMQKVTIAMLDLAWDQTMADNERLKFGIRAVIYSNSHRAGVGGPLVSLDEQPDYIQDLERVLKGG